MSICEIFEIRNSIYLHLLDSSYNIHPTTHWTRYVDILISNLHILMHPRVNKRSGFTYVYINTNLSIFLMVLRYDILFRGRAIYRNMYTIYTRDTHTNTETNRVQCTPSSPKLLPRECSAPMRILNFAGSAAVWVGTTIVGEGGATIWRYSWIGKYSLGMV